MSEAAAVVLDPAAAAPVAAPAPAPAAAAPAPAPAAPAPAPTAAAPAPAPAAAAPAPAASTATGAPEAYADFKLPDGYALDAELGTEFKAAAKELNLNQDQAQKLFDLGVKSNQASAAKIQAMAATAKAQWQSESQSDKEIGGNQAAEHRATANKAFTSFGTPELRRLLDESGLGEHPEVIRWAYRVGKAMGNDTHVPGGASASTNGARGFYDKSSMNP